MCNKSATVSLCIAASCQALTGDGTGLVQEGNAPSKLQTEPLFSLDPVHELLAIRQIDFKVVGPFPVRLGVPVERSLICELFKFEPVLLSLILERRLGL